MRAVVADLGALAADRAESCLRFTKLENLPLDLVGEVTARGTLDDFVDHYRDAER